MDEIKKRPLFQATSSFVHYFKTISDFKVDLQSEKAQLKFGDIFCPVWSCNLADDLEKQWNTSFMLLQAWWSFRSHRSIYTQETRNSRGNRQLFVFCDLGIWGIILKKKYSAPPQCNFKLCASLYCHRSIQTGVTARKLEIQIKGDFSVPCDLQVWRMTLKNKRALLLCYFKLCASFHCHLWIQTGVTVWKPPIQVKIGDLFVPCDLELWRMTLEINGALLLHHSKLCALFHRFFLIQTKVTVRKRLNGVCISVTFTFELWPSRFAWTSLLSMVVTPENLMIWWWEHSEQGVTDRQTDKRTDGLNHS